MKRSIALLLAMVLTLSLLACAKEEEVVEKLGGIHTDSGDIYPESFLTFDKQKITFDEFRYFYLNYRDMHLEEDPSYFEKEGAEAALKNEVLGYLRDNWALRFLAKENKVTLNREEKEAIKADMEEAASVFGSKDAFISDLHASYMSQNYYEDMMEYASLSYKLFNKLFDEGGKEAYSDEEFYDFFRENYLSIQQIYLPFEEGENAENCPKTKAAAESIRREAEGGADFWSLVEKYGKDENMLSHPDGYYFTKGQAEDTLYEASKALKTDEISQPVVGQTGVYLIRRMELKKARMDENRDVALFGYRDTMDEWHPGEYDRVFQELIRKRAEKIKVSESEYWDMVSTKTVY